MDYSSVISALAAAGGLIFTGITIWRNSEVRQLQMADSIFRDLQRLERQLSDITSNGLVQDANKLKTWEVEFFNNLEWVCFMINKKKLREKKLVLFFKDAIIGWYNDIFLKYASEQEISDSRQYTELKKFYDDWKDK
jgi:hypothetical protein